MVKRVKLRQPSPRYGDFSTFQDGGRRHLGFLKCEILMIGRFKGAKLRRRAKFGQNRSNRGQHMAIFRFFQDGGRPPSWICYVCVRTTNEGHLMVFIAVQNLIGIDAVVFITCMFFDFASLAWKPQFTPPKLGFWGILPPKWRALSTKPKRHILARARVV